MPRWQIEYFAHTQRPKQIVEYGALVRLWLEYWNILNAEILTLLIFPIILHKLFLVNIVYVLILKLILSL
jgi:hypothetical protein